jgi:FkbM family methyltransferase
MERLIRFIYERGVYEYGTLQFLKDNLKPGDHFVDVGANIGFMTLYAANCVGNNGAVDAFEPVATTARLLQRNIELNKEISCVIVHEFALGAESKRSMIYSETGNRGGASIIANTDVHDGEEIEIRTLDEVVQDMQVDVIKIDVEGFELEVLKGAQQTIAHQRPILIVEYSLNRTNEGGDDGIHNFLSALHNYKLYKLERGKERPSKLIEITSKAELPQHDNLFCIPMGR